MGKYAKYEEEVDNDLLPSFEKSLFLKMEEVESERKHLAGGVSGHGECVAKQAMQIVYKNEFGNHGALVPGTMFHAYWQGIFESGSIVKDDKGVETWLIIGHEQYIFYQDGFNWRKSPIDTLVFNLITKEFEIWDWKSTRKDIKYVNCIERKDEMQVNFYAYRFSEAWDLQYYPMCRVIYGEKVNYNHLKNFAFRCNDELYKKSTEYMRMVHTLVDCMRSDRSVNEWEKYATGLDYWSATKTPYRSQCRYCDFTEKCLVRLGYGSFEDYDEAKK